MAATPRLRPASRPRLRTALGRPLGKAAALLVLLVLLLAIFGPVIWGAAAKTNDLAHLLAPPSGKHWAGTDGLGRDLFARVMVATRLTILLTLEATAIGVVAGLLLGSAPFLLGRVVGKAVTWFIGVAVAFPGILLALFFAVIFGAGAASAALALGLASAPSFARLCQTLVAGILGRDYVAAATIGGVGRMRILLRHILPNIGEPLVVNATVGAGGVLLSFAGLSFLGLGVQPPSYDWGRLMTECLQSIYVHPVASLTPGLAVIVAGLAFNLTGESIAQSLGIASIGDLGLRGRWRSRRRSRALLPDGAAAFAARSSDAARASGRGESLALEIAAPSDIAPSGTYHDPTPGAVLSVRDLTVSFPAGEALIRPVRGVSFDLAPGEAVGLVGESGSGKSLTALAIAQLIEEPGIVAADALRFLDTDLLPSRAPSLRRRTLRGRRKPDGKAHRHLLGTSMALVFQDPMTSLNPTQRVGAQLAELGRAHGGYTRRAAWARAVERLDAVRIDHPERRARQYPHEFSGGMRQRAMIGLGVMLAPKLIIADEPTTALDVTVQAQVLDLLASIRRADGVALLLISHDVSVVREVCDRTMVMYAGRIVEDLPTRDLARSAHPYTQLLVAAVPTMRTDLDAPLPTIPGRPPEPAVVGQDDAQRIGCAFAPRCPLASGRCRVEEPGLVVRGEGRVACWHAGEPIAAATAEVDS